MTNLVEIVKSDAVSSANRWEGAVDGAERDGDADAAKLWERLGAECAERFDAAIEAIEAGDLAEAEAQLERANLREIEGGDNCDADHALRAVRAACRAGGV